MQVNLLKSKILRAKVTDCSLQYERSLAIDSELMQAVGLLSYEKILVGNINTGSRFETYAIPAAPGSRTIVLNGAAARLGQTGDLLVILAFTYVPIEATQQWRPKVVVLGTDNQILKR